MGEKIKHFLQEQSNREAEEILAQVNADTEMADVHAPEEMEAALFARIDEYEKEKAHQNLSEEDKELIELGKAYKKHKKRRKLTAVASIAIMGMLFSGITAMGGPEKVVEVVRRMVEERDHTVVNADDERVEPVKAISEEEAYEQIEQEFGFTPVKMVYIPKEISFQKYEFYKDTQYISMLYRGKGNKIIRCVVWPNYKEGSVASDVEDLLIETYTRKTDGREIIMKHYVVQENSEERWSVEFQEDSAYYFMQIYNLDEGEVENIIDNLYFE